VERDGRAGIVRVTAFLDRASARQAFAGDLRSAANRFFRGATGKSTGFRIIDLEDGTFRFAFFSPARMRGYGKLYVQEIDQSGNVLREYKETWGPDGVLETKWIHGGPS
jgi:hypothetical protein